MTVLVKRLTKTLGPDKLGEIGRRRFKEPRGHAQ